MNRLRISTTVFLSFIAVGLPSLVCTTGSFSEERLAGGNESASSVMELLNEEVLDTVLLARPVHFTTPDVTDTVASPETYQVLAAGQNRLKLVAVKGKRTIIVDALNINHTEDIATPIALYVRDDEKFPHVVLLLPGGKGLEVVGSYDAIRARGIRAIQLTPIQIQSALKKKFPLPR